MESGTPRRQLHGYVSNEARDGWYRFAEANDTNVTALLEAFGLQLGELATGKTSAPPVIRHVVAKARRVAGRRSTRRRD
jgi:hypothetical protein